MGYWTKEKLKKVLEEDFLNNPNLFGPGRRNDDMVDSMCICHALDEEWTEFYAKWGDNWITGKENFYFDKFLADHYERVKKWLDAKEAHGFNRGEDTIMGYAINY